jgi:hypothetical protein
MTVSDLCFQYVAIFIASHRSVPPVTPFSDGLSANP